MECSCAKAGCDVKRQLVTGGLVIGLLTALAAALAVALLSGAAAQQTERAVAISVGDEHACALLNSGAIECWGNNDSGQTDAPSGTFREIGAGASHSCGLRENGAIVCWGYTFDGQAQPPTGKQIAISAGYDYACALSETGTVSCWVIYRGVADVPAWLRTPAVGMPTTGTGGLLDERTSAPLVA